MAATQLERTNGTPTLTTKCTISVWIKRNGTSIGDSAKDEIIAETYTNDTNFCFLRLDGADTLNIYGTGITSVSLSAPGVLRDPNAWYHIVAALDSTESANADKVKLYINGIQQTLSGSTFPSSAIGFNNSGSKFNIGKSDRYANFDFDGTMSHYHFIDGTAYPASTFGSTDSVTGQWKINTSPSVTYGDQGFFILKDGNSVTDQSGEGNNLTVSTGTLTQTEDSPSNVFATMNPLIYSTGNNTTLSNGNTTVTSSGASHKNAFSSLGVSSGKWYCEIEVDTLNTHQKIGVASDDNVEINKTSPSEFSGNANGYAYRNDGQKEGGGGSISSYGNTYTNGDIIGIAMDLDNNKLYFSKNGTYQNSGVPTSGATGTGAISIVSGHSYLASFAHYNTMVDSINFGQGYFGTTQVASAGTAPSEGGIFEYNCPSGYQSLCTKGINSF